jgi:hypothetical protein
VGTATSKTRKRRVSFPRGGRLSSPASRKRRNSVNAGRDPARVRDGSLQQNVGSRAARRREFGQLVRCSAIGAILAVGSSWRTRSQTGISTSGWLLAETETEPRSRGPRSVGAEGSTRFQSATSRIQTTTAAGPRLGADTAATALESQLTSATEGSMQHRPRCGECNGHGPIGVAGPALVQACPAAKRAETALFVERSVIARPARRLLSARHAEPRCVFVQLVRHLRCVASRARRDGRRSRTASSLAQQ